MADEFVARSGIERKAHRLLAQGKVTVACGIRGLHAVVEGDHGSYSVRLTRRGPSCRVLAGGARADHALAVSLITGGRE